MKFLVKSKIVFFEKKTYFTPPKFFFIFFDASRTIGNEIESAKHRSMFIKKMYIGEGQGMRKGRELGGS